MNKEQRKYPRFTFNCYAQCAFIESFPECFSVMVVNVSPVGIGFISGEKLDVGTNIYFILQVGNGESVRFITEVRWSQRIENSAHFRIGVKILDSNNKDLEKFIQYYCKHITPQAVEKKRILIIEDEKEIIELLRNKLAQYDCDIVYACDGLSGFSRYMAERPDLIILDIVIPKMSGYEICRKIRKLQNDTDTLIFLLIDKKKDMTKIVDDDIEIQKYFIKPFKVDHFLSEVEEILNLQKN